MVLLEKGVLQATDMAAAAAENATGLRQAVDAEPLPAEEALLW